MAEFLPPENYVRLQPNITYETIYSYTGSSYEENEELCSVACKYLEENQELVKKALDLLV